MANMKIGPVSPDSLQNFRNPCKKFDKTAQTLSFFCSAKRKIQPIKQNTHNSIDSILRKFDIYLTTFLELVYLKGVQE